MASREMTPLQAGVAEADHPGTFAPGHASIPDAPAGTVLVMKDQRSGYPAAWNAPTVDDGEWLSQGEAARQLRVGAGLRIGMLIVNERLQPAHNSAGEAGVTLSSVAAELTWRQQASLWGRLRRFIADLIGWV